MKALNSESTYKSYYKVLILKFEIIQMRELWTDYELMMSWENNPFSGCKFELFLYNFEYNLEYNFV